MQFDFHESFLSTYIPKAIVELCLQENIPEEQIFAQLDISIHELRNKYFKLTYSQMNILVSNCLSALTLDKLSIKVGQRIQLGDLGLVGQTLLHSPTLRDAFHILERYSVLIDPALWFKVEAQDKFIIIRYRKMIPLGDIYQYSQEVISFLLIRLLTQLFKIEDLQLDLEFSTPSYARQLSFLKCSIAWEQAETRLVIPIADLDKTSIINQDKAQFCQLKILAENDFKSFFSVKKYWIFRVMSLIHSNLNEPLKAKDFAELLFISRSTFFRKLQEYQTNYDDLIQHARMDFASNYLIQNKGSISALSYYLGFSHPSNFIKSFKHFFGQTPKQWQNLHVETIAPFFLNLVA